MVCRLKVVQVYKSSISLTTTAPRSSQIFALRARGACRFPAFATHRKTTTVPLRGRHGNTAVAFSSETFLARAGLARPRDYSILSTVRTRMRTRSYYRARQYIYTGMSRARVRGRPNSDITPPRRPWLVRFPRATVAAFSCSEDPHLFPLTVFPFVDRSSSTTCAVIFSP